MRAAVLHLAFDGLGAQRAVSEAFHDNPSSRRVSEKLGYDPNGTYSARRRDHAAMMHRYLLTRDRWQRRDDIAIVGLDACRGLLGLD